jgi:predicted nucleic acid-binding protein
MIFVDTSGLFAFLDESDRHHPLARAGLSEWLAGSVELVTHNYVVAETAALTQRRLGAGAAADFLQDLAALFTVIWVGRDLHEAAEASFVAAPNRSVSLVDRVSFQVMRRLGIDRAFTFDADFRTAGFRTIPD